jgi:hypothetical protein
MAAELGRYGQGWKKIGELAGNVKQLQEIDLMHNDVTRLDAREDCWS